MNDLGAYILSVTAAGILCSLGTRIAGDRGTTGVILRLLCGIIMASVILSPIGSIGLPNLSGYFAVLEDQTAAAVSSGTALARQELSGRITQQARSYILDKAEELGMTLGVRVILDDGTIPVPVRIELSGAASPAAKAALTEFISHSLGIGKEDQIWK